MNRSIRTRSALVCAVAMLAALACSNTDEATNIPADQAVEAGLNQALTTTVVPVVTFMGAIGNLIASPAAAHAVGGYACPDTTGWCSGGSVTCSLGPNGLDFEFAACQLVTGDTPITLTGFVTAVPGSMIYLTMTDLVISGNTAISGTGTIDVAGCAYGVDIDAGGTSVSGTVTQCSGDAYPRGNTLVVAFGDFTITIDLNGTSLVPATALQNGTPVAACTIDLAVEPLASSCDAL